MSVLDEAEIRLRLKKRWGIEVEKDYPLELLIDLYHFHKRRAEQVALLFSYSDEVLDDIRSGKVTRDTPLFPRYVRFYERWHAKRRKVRFIEFLKRKVKRLASKGPRSP